MDQNIRPEQHRTTPFFSQISSFGLSPVAITYLTGRLKLTKFYGTILVLTLAVLLLTPPKGFHWAVILVRLGPGSLSPLKAEIRERYLLPPSRLSGQ